MYIKSQKGEISKERYRKIKYEKVKESGEGFLG
jgi:hypothetical protein